MFQWVGDINAGFPSAAEGYEDQPLDLYELIPNPAATFFFRVKGDDLRHEHLRDGSYLIVDRSIIAHLWMRPLTQGGQCRLRYFPQQRRESSQNLRYFPSPPEVGGGGGIVVPH